MGSNEEAGGWGLAAGGWRLRSTTCHPERSEGSLSLSESPISELPRGASPPLWPLCSLDGRWPPAA